MICKRDYQMRDSRCRLQGARIPCLLSCILFLVSHIFLIMMMQPGNGFCAWPDNPELNLPICTADGTQEHPRITTDGASGAIIVWQDISSESSDIYAQRVDARGIVRWTRDGVAICLEKENQWLPDLVSDGAGGAIMAWWDERVGHMQMDIYAQRINGDGEVQWQSGGIPICGAPKAQKDFNITSDGKGGAIIAWHDYRAESGTPDIYAQRVNAAGEVLWKQDGVVISKAANAQQYPSIAGDGAGGAIIAWHEWRNGNGDVYAQRVDAKGKALWQEDGIPVCKVPEHQWYAEVVSDGEGGVIIAWMDARNSEDQALISRTDYDSGSGWDIYAERVDPLGNPLWQIDGAPVCLAPGDQYDYSLVGDGAGGAFIAWHDQRSGNWDIYAQKLDASGSPEWEVDGMPVCKEPGDQYNPNLVGDEDGGIIVAWWDKRYVYSDVFAQRIDRNGKSLWAESGVAICIAEGNQQDAHLVNSGFGSAIITWWDKRRVDADIYVQRVFSE